MIHFENFTIKPLELEDLNAYFELVERNRERLKDFFTGTVSRTDDLQSTKEFLNEMINKRTEKKYFPFLLIDNNKNEIIAFFDLKNIDWKIPKSEIGCYTDEKYIGKGITSKAMKHFIEYCLEYFQFKKIFLRTHESNKAAQAIAEKCGFELEGIIKMDYKTTSGVIIDLMYYGLINLKINDYCK